MSDYVLYIDPTAAGLGLQMLLGGIVGGLVAIKLLWGRFFSLFRRYTPETEETLATSEEPREEKGKEAFPHR